MKVSPASGAESSTADAIGALLPSWHWSLVARRVSPRTIATYTTSVEQLGAFLAAAGMPTAVARIKREHVEAFLEDPLLVYDDQYYRPTPSGFVIGPGASPRSSPHMTGTTSCAVGLAGRAT